MPTRAPSSEAAATGAPLWPLGLLAALVAVAIGAWLFLRRRRAAEDPWAEETYVEAADAPVTPLTRDPVPVAPVPVQAPPPVQAPSPVVPADPIEPAPVVATETHLAEPDAEEVAALTAETVASDRPWLELALRPIRAGTNGNEAVVEIELTVGNAGAVAARDVRISTAMLPAGNDRALDRVLADRGADGVAPIVIPAGGGARVEATLAMDRAALSNGADHAGFHPIIVAAARYRLPDGGEGRTAASFLIGTMGEGALAPIALDRPGLTRNVEAQLYREPERV